ncbi:hypothetical protein Barb6XT_01782 [Bacteroidales bacterium Barb6XT]|nr:hypothetical protein Barb6XT_01782 [Bacteroidales bacterium Barb6XT]
MSSNPSLPWSVKFIEKYKDRWNWGRFGLSENPSLPWSVEFIEKYKDKWDWGKFGLFENPSLPWSIELIEKYKDKWEYEDKWNLDPLRWNDSVFNKAFKPYLTDPLVEEIMQKITESEKYNDDLLFNDDLPF